MRPQLQAFRAVSIIALPLLLSPAASSTTGPSPSGLFLVVCSPGSPGTTLQAQPTMDSFARAAAVSAGWPEGSLGAAYFETAETGLTRLRQPDAALALVPPAFLAQYGEELALKPRMEAVLETGKPELWSLVAKKGKISSPASLKGWEVSGAPGFAPDYVRGDLLKEWGPLPADARVTFTARILTALRRAAAGEPVAVLLDSAATASLPSLPFAGDLEVVARSRPVAGAILCTVGSRMTSRDSDSLIRGLSHLPEKEGGAEILKSLRLSSFRPLGQGLSASPPRLPGRPGPGQATMIPSSRAALACAPRDLRRDHRMRRRSPGASPPPSAGRGWAGRLPCRGGRASLPGRRPVC